MASEPQGIERRRHPRANLSASAVVINKDLEQRLHLVENLSAGGALIIGDDPLEEGQEIVILLMLSERPSVKIRAQAVRCVEHPSGQWKTGVEFRHKTHETEDMIQDLVLAILERQKLSE